ncbi:MAG TPA: hypothetical protein VND54_13215 [Candidatus Saccharimonadales bacterium]|nr:hypothetical protein [Candidatus Saccharimonadales bacterium]
MTAEPAAARLRRRLWIGAMGALAALVAVRSLVDLSGSPPGNYVDEASIGYNAWTIAHFGVDEHGIHFPLFFEAFGEYKNPVYVYAVAALVRFLPLTVVVERLPAAIFGCAAVGFLTAAAWRLTRSRMITLGALALTACTPWLVIESRVGFETISMVALLSAALWSLSDPTPRRFGIAGVLLALAIYGYTTARLEILLIAAALAIAWGLARAPGWWRALVPIGAGYGVLGIYALLNPGALTGRFDVISIWADGAPLGVVADRFLANYLSYFSPGFLFLQGDANPRQNTEIGGMLLWVMAPLLIAGVLVCWQRRRQPLVRFVVAGILLAPIAAALTNNGTPHALRSSGMLPFLVVLAVLGADGLRTAPAGRAGVSRVLGGVLGAGLLAQAVLFTVDLYAAYPNRAAPSFDTGEIAAITTARDLAGSHRVSLSDTLDQPYIEAFFAYLPPPPPRPETDDATPGLAALGMEVVSPDFVAASHPAPGDVLVLSQFDPAPPSGWTLVASERGPANLLDASAPRPVIESVYRFGG